MKTTELIVWMEEKQRQDKSSSYWERGVWVYAFNMVASLGEDAEINTQNALHILLNGARDWKEYSYNGNAYISDIDIAETLCTPSELKKNKGGLRNPNCNENWLDVQARALYQAYYLIASILKACAHR